MTEELRREIDAAYRELGEAVEELGQADRLLEEHVRRVKVDNAEALLEAKNERTATLYLEGLLDTDEHRDLSREKARADMRHQLARREVERVGLVVRLAAGSPRSEAAAGYPTLEESS